ncbi:hypothetical protein [Streptomyces xanthophaeus]|uniref:Uncharacterized protein n=1 Tax=Streptomyces xanthophaeus TaxID=67385 RepID=A0A919GXC4_9ACTN|nr:hypothetical protein [Streptomyces xanthophaeus]GHI82883.1 hypothetical protein Sxan_02470 [Streptomyces xanthophaeus]
MPSPTATSANGTRPPDNAEGSIRVRLRDDVLEISERLQSNERLPDSKSGQPGVHLGQERGEVCRQRHRSVPDDA